MKHDTPKICDATFQPALPVLPPIKFRILQTSPHDSLAASTNATVLIRKISDHNKVRQQSASANPVVRRLHRKILLLIFEHRGHNFSG